MISVSLSELKDVKQLPKSKKKKPTCFRFFSFRSARNEFRATFAHSKELVKIKFRVTAATPLYAP